MLRHQVCGLLVALLLVGGAIVGANPSFADEAQAKPLRVGLFALKPWGVAGKNGRPQGVTRDQFEAIAARTGLKFTYHLVPYARMLRELKAGHLDMSIFFSRPPGEGITLGVARVHDEENVIYAREGLPLKSREDLKGLTLAVPKGVAYSCWFDEDKELSKYFTLGHWQSIAMLKAKRLDAIAGPRSALMYNLKGQGLDPQKLEGPLVIGRKEAWLQVSKINAHKLPLKQLFDAVESLKKDGRFRENLMFYFGAEGLAEPPDQE